MAKRHETGELTPFMPRYENGEFVQDFEFRTNVKISRGGLEQITKVVTDRFKHSIQANKIAHFSWPPGRVELTPHADFQGFALRLGTLATEPGGSALQFAPPN